MTDRKRRYQNWGARLIAYPCWIGAVGVGVAHASGRLTGTAPVVAEVVLLGIAMPIGVKLSRLELTDTMIAVFRTGLAAAAEDERARREAFADQEKENHHGLTIALNS